MARINYIIIIFCGALCYFALGKVGLQLALPLSHATIFWPPAGLSLGLMLVYGVSVWPAIFFGSMAVVLYGNEPSMQTMVLAVGVPIAATLQAYVGTKLIQRTKSGPYTLEQFSEIIKILFYGGIVAGVISTSLSNLTLLLNEQITPDAYLTSWVSWYFGDLIGIFILCPFTILLLSPSGDIPVARKVLICLSSFLMMLTVGITLFQVEQWQVRSTQDYFRKQGELISSQIQQTLHQHLDILASITNFYHASTFITADEFKRFNSPFLEKFPDIQSLTWHARVSEKERYRFLEKIQPMKSTLFTIRERNFLAREEGKQKVYFPVTYRLPDRKQNVLDGLDIYSHDNTKEGVFRKTINAALDSQSTALLLGYDSSIKRRKNYMTLYHPIYYYQRHADKPRKLDGLVALTIDTRELLSEVAQRANRLGMQLVLDAAGNDAGQHTLFDSRLKERRKIPDQRPLNSDIFSHNYVFDFAGKALDIKLIQNNDFAGTENEKLLWITLLSGLLFTGLLTLLLLITTGRTQMISRLAQEKAMELSEADNILEESLNEIYIVDVESFKLLHANISALSNMQYQLDELRTLTPFDIVVDLKDSGHMEELEKLKAGQLTKLVVRAQHRRKDGSTYEVETHLQNVSYRDKPAILALVMDITDKEEMAQEIEQRKQALEVIFENVPVQIWAIDDTLNVLNLNTAAAAYIGGKPEDYVGKKLSDIVPDSTEKAQAENKEILKSGKPKLGILDHSFMNDNGQHWLLKNKVPYYDARLKRDCLLIVSQDVSELKHTEKKLAKAVEKLTASNQELERFAYIASHDLQEPLRMVRNFTELLDKKYSDELDKTARSYLAITSSSATYMQELVDDLLNYARIDQYSDKVEVTDVNRTLEYIKNSLHNVIMDTKATITHDPLPTIHINPVAFSSVMQNMITNAMKYCPKDRAPQIHISPHEKEKHWIFEVNDNGIGMKEEYLETIFEPFKRLHSKEEYQGTGMGLAICRKTLENIGGKIWAESKLGEGSTFFIQVPKQE